MINNNLDYEKNSNTTTASTSSTHNSNNLTNHHAPPNNNGYFNRFDNRIAANLAAVITGSRFRTSSSPRLGRSTNANANANANAHTNANGLTTSVQNLSGKSASSGPQTPKHRYGNGVATLRGRQQPPSHLPLSNASSRPSSPMLSNGCGGGGVGGGGCGSIGRRRPLNLFTQANLNCNDNEKVVQTPSSDEDNSPTELNNCKRLADKPPLVKRLTMGLLRSHEESRPLVNSAVPTTNTNLKQSQCSTSRLYSNGYINEEAFEPEKFIASKFGDSCRQSLTAIPMLDTLNLNDNSEFNLKKRYLRETSSANSSPKIFANRLRAQGGTANNSTRFNGTSTHTNTHIPSSLACSFSGSDDEEAELKDASWFQAGISRDIAVEVLSSKSPGAFLVRKSSSKPGCYALTLRVPSPPGPKIANYIILRTARGFKIKGFRKEFSSLKALITHHSVMPELLPVPLAMPRPTNMTSSRRNLDDFDTYDSLQMLLKYLRAKNLENE